MDHGECARPCGKVRIARLNGGAITGHGARWPGATGRAALAAIGAVSGIGLSSGREYVLFFGQMGVTATVGVLAASAFFGLLGAGIARRRTRGIVCVPDGLASALSTLRLLMAALASVAMLLRLGALGAIMLPLRHGAALGMAAALALALAIHRAGILWAAGLCAGGFAALFYAGLALDPTPVRPWLDGYTELALAGSLGWALAFAALYACMNACAAAWTVRVSAGRGVRPAGFGARLFGAMLLVLWLEGRAVRRGGDALLAQEAPLALLSARWGLAGFWLCAGFQFVCAVCTLSASAGILIDGLRTGGQNRARAVLAVLVGAIAACALLPGLY